MKNALWVVALLVVLLGMATCSGKSKQHDKDVMECTKRGIEYFKEIGSYPKLKTAPNAGRFAGDVAEERCSRSLQAF